jgi:FkbM family methyltransferase
MVRPAVYNPNHSRSARTIFRSVFQRRHYRAAVEAIRQCRRPINFLSRYVTESGQYPTDISLRTPTGLISLTLYSWHDSRTVHEIFLAFDYLVDNSAKVVVDFGSNIGISAAYFLSRNPTSKAYLFEPVKKNVERLNANLRQFAGRFELSEVALGESDGKVRFGVEPSGRYGGIGVNTGEYIDVACKDSNGVLKTIIAENGRIDVLKIDVEHLEGLLIGRLTGDLASKIGLIIVELLFDHNPLEATHTMTFQGGVSRFVIKDDL